MDEPEVASLPAIRKLSVIVPVFNERNTVVEVLRRMRAVELPEGIQREFVVVDDGSSDGTVDVLRQLGDSTVHIVLHDVNRGKGAAVRTGLGHATGDYVLIQDADLEYDPEDWPRLLTPVLRGKARVVYGSRFTGERRNMLFLHWVGNRMLSLITNVLYNTTLSDMETCYKLADRALLLELDLQSDRFDIEPEITAKILKRRIRIYEVPISYTGREFDEGKKITWRDGIVALWTLVKIYALPTDAEPERASWAAVVVNYDGGALLEACVRSVLADSSAGAVELVVVDNASTDGSVEALLRAHPAVHVVHSPGNVGYARGANLGIAATSAPIVAVLNPDTEVEPGTARALVDRLVREPRLAACGPRVRNTDGTDYPSARQVPSIPVAVGHGLLGLWWPRNPFTVRYRQLEADPGKARLVDWVSGAAIWLRRTALDDVGGWDERYFMYFEDIDLCWRLRRASWDVAYEPAGVVDHVQGASTARRPYRMLLEHHRSAWKFARTRFTGPRAVLLPLAAAYLATRALMAMGAHAWRSSRFARAAS